MNFPRSFSFGPFLLIPERQLLLRGASRVRIGCRALDLLTALVERPGELVAKTELMTRVWPSTIVEEANLKVNMSTLRRVLGDGVGTPDYIATVPGRGYRFVAAVQTTESREAIEFLYRDLEKARILADAASAGIPSSFKLTDAEAPMVAEICRRLEGIALAIELTRRALNTRAKHPPSAPRRQR
jgi:DNA-binding winged helix-turn-helix (wHTH) protein